MKQPVMMLLRLEGCAVLLVSLLLYNHLSGHWGRFALGFFVPDLAMAGYLAGNRAGAIIYNLTHSYTGPLLLIAIALLMQASSAVTLGIIWTAHIGFDRMLGYGLKYARGFSFTHLGAIGKQPSVKAE